MLGGARYVTPRPRRIDAVTSDSRSARQWSAAVALAPALAGDRHGATDPDSLAMSRAEPTATGPAP